MTTHKLTATFEQNFVVGWGVENAIIWFNTCLMWLLLLLLSQLKIRESKGSGQWFTQQGHCKLVVVSVKQTQGLQNECF